MHEFDAMHTAWVFFLISWVLERSLVWNSVREYISQNASIPGKDLDNTIAGIHIRAVGGLHNTLQVPSFKGRRYLNGDRVCRLHYRCMR